MPKTENDDIIEINDNEQPTTDLTVPDIHTKLAVPKTFGDVADMFAAFGEAATGRRFRGELLKFAQGIWTVGVDGKNIPIGTEVIVAMSTLKAGWTCWRNGSVVDEAMGLVADGYQAPERAELGDLDQEMWDLGADDKPRDPWQKTFHVEVSPKDDPSVIWTFTTSSWGGQSAIGSLSTDWARKIRHCPNAQPIVELDVGFFQIKGKSHLGRIKKPMLSLVGWHEAAPPPYDGGEAAPVAPEGTAAETPTTAVPEKSAPPIAPAKPAAVKPAAGRVRRA